MLGEFLGEGAWHYAWQVNRGEQQLVLRIPKTIAYGKQVSFDEAALKAEYAGTKLYYQTVNKAHEGAAPLFFDYHVTPELTYTIETYGGSQIDLHTITLERAYKIGLQTGAIHKATEEIPHGLAGFGYLAWSEEKGLHGALNGDVSEFIYEESEEHLADYQALCLAYLDYDDIIVKKALQLAVNLRKKAFIKPLLGNQDVSPENILCSGENVCLIDPYPSVYYARGMAGNFMNLYETYFVALADTERYKKHRFHECKGNLRMIAKGFIEGYSAGNQQIVGEIRGEQLLQLLETAHSHFRLLSEDVAKETEIRYGNKEAIEKRVEMLCRELKELAASQIKVLV
ncbi:hypothetical protein B481_2709 [Planococcus halocryophilus Or1]|uniref:Aminoglycoside phosphotransferase domain-containing protein n=2 Tax=Planococcus halocryophilus TaxID=1215089 RepID=A0A1C7DVN2_9BACL|nr:hypothetical protein BBI08_05320 [Planococcus halocryophilus]EMF45866.1 hypothetical protein B481_2709 [Planococcus halocryophilus Or1]